MNQLYKKLGLAILQFIRGLSFLLLLMLLNACSSSDAEREQVSHPNLTLTSDGVKEIRRHLGQSEIFDQSVAQLKAEVQDEILQGIDVPFPKDLAGGYTHERHKANFFAMQKAGVLYQITGEEQYALYVRDMLLAYAKIFPSVDRHPATRSYARGKFFWQCLNDANWLVYSSQAYDCIYLWLDEESREVIDNELFRPYADFISLENPRFFNRWHNHSTWGNAAVGMVGLVLNDEELIDRALYAFDISESSDLEDNDGGKLNLKGYKEGGFLAQIDQSFSPDGYYTEGPYYQRYAMYPFLVFAQALTNKRPDLQILNYREGLLLKAVYTLIQQTNVQGEFFPINDAQKGMSLHSRELVNAVSMAYHYGGNDPQLLSIIEQQQKVPVNDAGLSAALAIQEGKSKPFEYKSLEISDGAEGTEGAIGIVREGNLSLLMKYAKHGMGHGHFDRLSFLLNDDTGELIQDYGSARWVNIEHKEGGGYLPENHSWAKETIAHNTVVVNQQSHFDHNVKQADQTAGEPYYFFTSDDLHIVSAKESNAYPDTEMHRTMVVANIEELEHPLLLDLFQVTSDDKALYDLPTYYLGEYMSSSHGFDAIQELHPMGQSNGYQHLWAETPATPVDGLFQFTWFNKKRFYTMTSLTYPGDQVILTRIGANDPNFNLRRDPGILVRRKARNTVFASLYESHGSYDYDSERPSNLFSSVDDLQLTADDSLLSMTLRLKSGSTYRFNFAQNDLSESHDHQLTTKEEEKVYWSGVHQFQKIK